MAAPHFSALIGFGLDAAGMPAIADAGFRPGKDDWQFVNYGAFVAPGGICEGMSLSAIWYYVEQHRRAGASRLHGLYDNDGADPRTPGFQDDDAQAYRFASAVHEDPIAALPTYRAFRNRWALPDVRLTLAALRMAIYATGEPQLLRVTTDPAKGGGHTMIVYRVARNRIFIADPNWPAQYRWIDVDEAKGAFAPYSSGANARAIAEQGATAYPFISYVPWRIARSTAAIAARWAELEANAAGDTTFPPVALGLITGWTPQGQAVLAYTTARTLRTDQATVPLVIKPLPGAAQTSMRVYRGRQPTPVGGWTGTQHLDLEPGDNLFGVLVKGRVQDGTDAAGNPTWTWAYVDYVRLTLTRGDATPARGSWVLTSAAADGGANAQSFQKADETLTVTSSSGGVSVDYEYVGPPHRKESVVTTWSAPPPAMRPGETWRGTVTASGACPGEYDQGWAGNVTLSIVPAGARSDAISSTAAGVTCDKATASAAFAWTFPASGPGLDHIDVLVSAGESHGGDSWTYRYEWRP